MWSPFVCQHILFDSIQALVGFLLNMLVHFGVFLFCFFMDSAKDDILDYAGANAQAHHAAANSALVRASGVKRLFYFCPDQSRSCPMLKHC